MNRGIVGLVCTLIGLSPAIVSAQDTMTVTAGNVHLVIKRIADQTKPGMKVDQYTSITDVQAVGKKLVVSYRIDVPGTVVSADDTDQEMHDANEKELCILKDLKTIIRYGGEIERTWFNARDELVMSVLANKKSCRKWW